MNKESFKGSKIQGFSRCIQTLLLPQGEVRCWSLLQVKGLTTRTVFQGVFLHDQSAPGSVIQDHLDEGSTSNEPMSTPFPRVDSSFPLMCYNMSDNESLILIQAILMECTIINSIISEFTQQDGRKKRTANRLCVTNMTRLLLTYLVVIFTNINVL